MSPLGITSIDRRFLALGMGLVLVACGDGAPESESPAATPEWTADPEPLVSIGRVEGPEEELLSQVTAAVLLPDGGVAIGDWGSSTVRIFDVEGRFRSALGGPGQGPGEFEYVSGLDFHPPDRLEVYDGSAQRLTTYALDGELVSTLSFRASTGYPEIYLGSFADGRHALAWIEQMGRDPERVMPDVMAVGRYGADGAQGASLTTAEGMLRLGTGPLPFSPHFLAVMVGDSLLVTDGRRPTIRVIGPDGALVRTLEIPAKGTAGSAAREVLASVLTQERQDRLAEISVPEADSVPFLSDLLTDRSGRLWAKLYDPAADSHWRGRLRSGGTWLALATNGTILARLTMPDDLRLLDITEDRLVGLARDDLGVERIRIHAVTVPGEGLGAGGGGATGVVGAGARGGGE